MIYIITAALLSYSATATTASEPSRTKAAGLRARGYDFSFEEYQAEYNKSYAPAELNDRKAAFQSALAQIRAHNEQTPAPSWWMGLSEHSDKSAAEWAQLKGLHRPSFFAHHASLRATLAAAPAAPAILPEAVDWRKEGVVTPVKNQGGCGSCWAFSATESVESALAMATRSVEGGKPELIELAPQQLVDCAPNPDDCGGSGGCEGSTQPLAFKYLISAGGMDAAADYAYTARDGTCKAGSLTPAVGIKGQVDLPTNNYTALIGALSTEGPIAISVDASWGGYEGGIFEPSDSGIATTIDHAVQLVGYGTQDGKDYWLVRNSWGGSWGENGYIRLRRYGEGKEPCGTDKRPADGFGCKGGPSKIQVCGTSGMLSGSSYPTGAFKE
jgi:cathepsin L